jgi:crossover junction endodeoxyribonuclease RusA
MTVQQVVLPFPISLNNAFGQTKTGRRFTSKRYLAWRHEALLKLKLAKVKPATGQVHIKISICPPDLRRRDIDNLSKGVVDLLVAGRVITDDDGRYVLSVSSAWGPLDRANPRATVEIVPAAA